MNAPQQPQYLTPPKPFAVLTQRQPATCSQPRGSSTQACEQPHQGDREQEVNDLIARLHSAELITVSDVDTLRFVSDGVFAKTRGELSAPALSDRIRSANSAAAADPSSSQVALAVLTVVAILGTIIGGSIAVIDAIT